MSLDDANLLLIAFSTVFYELYTAVDKVVDTFITFDIPCTMTDSDNKDTRKPRTSSPFKQGGVQNRLPRRRSVPAFMKESTRAAQEKQSAPDKDTSSSKKKQSQEGRRMSSERPVASRTTTTPRRSSNSSTARSGASESGRGQRGKPSGTGVQKPVQSPGISGSQRKTEKPARENPFKAPKPAGKRSAPQEKLPSLEDETRKNTEIPKRVQPEKRTTTGTPVQKKPSSYTSGSQSSSPTLPGVESVQEKKEPALPPVESPEPSHEKESESVLESSFESFLAELTDEEAPVVETDVSGKVTEKDDDVWLSDESTKSTPGTSQQSKKTFADHYVGDKKRSKKSGYDKRKIVEKYAKKRVDPKKRERYKHFTEHNKVTGRQIEFFQNLNLAHTYDKHVMADLLKPPVDMTAETREQKALRERLVRQALGGEEALKRDSKLRISPKDIEVMRFLARFQYATARHIARIYSETEGASQRRLNRLRERGLVLSNYFYGAKTIYWLTEEGMLLSGYDYKVLHQEKDINLQSFPHRFGLNHLAANIMGANVNVLDLDDFPQKNRESLVDGSMIEGETLVSEYEIHSTLARKRGSMRGEIYKPQIIAENRSALREWAKRKRDGMPDEENPSPEFIHGNEYMFALYPKEIPELVHHIPDLVVKRPRDPVSGVPRSIAVELELNVKRDKESYKRTMSAYKADEMMFKEVVWVSPEKDIRTVLERAADDVGLTETGRVRILPLYVEDGIFVNMNMWQL